MIKKNKSKKKKLTLNDSLKELQNSFKVSYGYTGPQKQLVVAYRFPMTFKNCLLTSGRVNFTNYLEWMGLVREEGMRYEIKEIMKLMKTGKWGLATNKVSLKIFNILKADDILEASIWIDKVTGYDNIYYMSFDWIKVKDNKLYERVASSRLVASFVEVIGHGKAKFAYPPPKLRKLFTDMAPLTKEKKSLKRYRSLMDGIKFGKKKKDFSSRPKFLFSNTFQATLENSNLVGNVYFANYARWINSTKDLFLNKKAPELFKRQGFNCEFVVLNFEINHLNEAMPFDKVNVKMFSSEVYEKAIVLKFKASKKNERNKYIQLIDASLVVGLVKYGRVNPALQVIPQKYLRLFDG